jgi:hypothetical protein
MKNESLTLEQVKHIEKAKDSFIAALAYVYAEKSTEWKEDVNELNEAWKRTKRKIEIEAVENLAKGMELKFSQVHRVWRQYVPF